MPSSLLPDLLTATVSPNESEGIGTSQPGYKDSTQ